MNLKSFNVSAEPAVASDPFMTLCYGKEINLVDFLPKVAHQIRVFWPMYVLYSMEAVLLSLDILLAVFLLKLFFSTTVWHKNLTYVTGFFVLIQIPAHFGRLIFIGYSIALQFQTAYCDVVLIIASCSQMMYAFVMAHASAGFLLERSFALYHLKDYERKSRSYISLCIIVFIIIAGVYFVYCNTLKTATEYFAYYVIVIVFTSILLFFGIILWNRKMIFRVSLSGKPEEYSLNKRFQLAENVRVLQLCKNTAVVASVWVMAVCSLLVYMDFTAWSPVGLMIFELLKDSGPLVVMITVILSMPKWKAHFLKLFRRKSKRIYAIQQPQQVRADETEMYFTQLAATWNCTK